MIFEELIIDALHAASLTTSLLDTSSSTLPRTHYYVRLPAAPEGHLPLSLERESST